MVRLKQATMGILILAAVGVVFSAYLSVPLLISGSCPILEGCHYLFGLPACVLSLLLFLFTLAGAVLLVDADNASAKTNLRIFLMATSGAGVLLLGYVWSIEMIRPICISPPCVYKLHAPLCEYGFVIYAIILYLVYELKQK